MCGPPPTLYVELYQSDKGIFYMDLGTGEACFKLKKEHFTNKNIERFRELRNKIIGKANNYQILLDSEGNLFIKNIISIFPSFILEFDREITYKTFSKLKKIQVASFGDKDYFELNPDNTW